MPLMKFDLEDGQPPVSFPLKPEDADRFMTFMAECQAAKNAVTAVRYAPLYAVLDENTKKAVDAALKQTGGATHG